MAFITNDSTLGYFYFSLCLSFTLHPFRLLRKNKNSIGLRGIWGAQSQFRIYVTRSTGPCKRRKQVDSHIRTHTHVHTHTYSHTHAEQNTSCKGRSGHCGQVDCGWAFGISVNVASHCIASRVSGTYVGQL